jgi:hypothetical protein
MPWWHEALLSLSGRRRTAAAAADAGDERGISAFSGYARAAIGGGVSGGSNPRLCHKASGIGAAGVASYRATAQRGATSIGGSPLSAIRL